MLVVVVVAERGRGLVVARLLPVCQYWFPLSTSTMWTNNKRI